MLIWLIPIAQASEADPEGPIALDAGLVSLAEAPEAGSGGPIALGAGVQGNASPAPTGTLPPLAPFVPGIRVHLGERVMLELAGSAGRSSEVEGSEETDPDGVTAGIETELAGWVLGGGATARVRIAAAEGTSAWGGVGLSGARSSLAGPETEQFADGSQEAVTQTDTQSKLQPELSVAAIHEIMPRLSVTADLGIVPWTRAKQRSLVRGRDGTRSVDDEVVAFVGAWMRAGLWVHVRL